VGTDDIRLTPLKDEVTVKEILATIHCGARLHRGDRWPILFLVHAVGRIYYGRDFNVNGGAVR